jgi:site-specific recombinase XerD
MEPNQQPSGEDRLNASIRDQAARKISSAGPEGHPAVVAAVQYIETRSNAGTARTYAHALAPWVSFCLRRGVDVSRAKPVHAEAFVAQLPEAKRSMCATVAREFHEHMLDNDENNEVGRNPFRRVRPKSLAPRHRTPSISKEEYERLLERCLEKDGDASQPFLNHRDFAMFLLMGRVGPRRIEVNRLTWGDVGGDNASKVRVFGKGSKWADIAIPSDVVEVLEAWRVALSEVVGRSVLDGDAVFPAIGRGLSVLRSAIQEKRLMRPLSLRAITTTARERLRDIGITGSRRSAHLLRATAATLAFKSGASIKAIQGMLRHASESTTHLYIDVADDLSPAVFWHVSTLTPPMSNRMQMIPDALQEPRREGAGAIPAPV